MSLALLLPIGLAALAALLVPLLLHLARRSEERVVMFAALRWLRSRPQLRSKRRFDEYLLLLLRLLLLAVLALLLSQPVLYGRPDRRPWVAVAPGVDAAALPAGVDARRHWLTPGFPEIDPLTLHNDRATATAITAAAAPGASAASLSSMLRQLDADLPTGTPLTVVVPDTLDGVDAERPQLSRQVTWQVVAAKPAPGRAPPPAQSMQLMVRHGPEGSAALRYLRAAGSAWQAASTDAAGTAPVTDCSVPVQIALATQPLDARQRNLVWLVPGPLPQPVQDWIAQGGTALLGAQVPLPALDAAAVLWRDDSGPLVRGTRLGKGRVMRLERALLPAQMPALLEPDFPERLQALFAPPPPAPARVAARDHRPRIGLPPYPEPPRPLSPWLAVFVASLFLAERWVANGPRRRQAA